jgi:ADP-heptose:LPS heptosyltransferase
LLRRCDLFVGNDTGPLHIAAAMGTPLVGIFGPTDERRFSPHGPRQRIVRLDWPCRELPRRKGADINRDCRSACLSEIEVETVFRECRALLDAAPAGPLAMRRHRNEAAVQIVP